MPTADGCRRGGEERFMRFTTLAEWLAWQESLHPKTIDLGLDRVRVVVQRMNLSHPPFTILSVGGTNGKGSTVAMLEAILRGASYRVGAYTSPHLLRYNERIRIESAEVADDALCAAFGRVDDARGDVSLTYFEFGTLAALDLFSRAGLDAVILEVGLGGRLDAVNMWDADVAVVTTVALDHTEWLGTDRETIAFEKAGIFRAGRPAVFGERDVPRRLREHAGAIGAPLYCYGADFASEPRDAGWNWRGPARARHALPIPALRGDHQIQNASAAIMALDLIDGRLPVTTAAIRDGLTRAYVAGRFEVVPGDVTTIFDVAHNPQGAEILAAALRDHRCTGRTLAVCGMLGDKDIAGTLRPMLECVDLWYVGTVDSPRAARAEQIEQILHSLVESAPATVAGTLREAHRRALDDARSGDRVVVFGSFYAVAGAL